MALQNSQLAQITARAGVLRSATGRAGAFARDEDQLRTAQPGQVVWQRPVATDGNPAVPGGAPVTHLRD